MSNYKKNLLSKKKKNESKVRREELSKLRGSDKKIKNKKD